MKLASLQHASVFLVPRTQSEAQSRNSVNEWMDGWMDGNPTHKPVPCLSTGPSLAFPMWHSEVPEHRLLQETGNKGV